jgi:hypothetical protein
MLKYLHEFIDHYRLLKLLKEGEFVGVYLAEDRMPNKFFTVV